MSTIGTHLLGRNLEHDPRSFAYGVEMEIKPVVITSVAHTLRSPALDQRDLGSCEGNTAAEWLNSGLAIRNRKAFWRGRGAPPTKGFNDRKYLAEINAIHLYSLGTQQDNDEIPGEYPPDDTGTSGVGVAKAMQFLGAIERYEWTFNFTDFLTTLMKQPVMLGTSWYDSMMEVDQRGHVLYPTPRADPIGGHAYLAYVLDWPNRRIGCTNHWRLEDGTPWGVTINRHQGGFWIQSDLLQRLLIHEQGESLVPVLL